MRERCDCERTNAQSRCAQADRRMPVCQGSADGSIAAVGCGKQSARSGRAVGGVPTFDLVGVVWLAAYQRLAHHASPAPPRSSPTLPKSNGRSRLLYN